MNYIKKYYKIYSIIILVEIMFTKNKSKFNFYESTQH